MSLRYDDPFEFPYGAKEFARQMASRVCWLPDKRTVAAFDSAPVFIHVDSKNLKDLTRFAFAWTQALPLRHAGWTIVNVFDPLRSSCVYLGGQILIQSWAESLAKPGGPLWPYLQYHAQQVYDLNPEIDMVSKPEKYDDIRWNYIDVQFEPKKHVLQKIQTPRRSGKPGKNAGFLENIEHWNTHESSNANNQ